MKWACKQDTLDRLENIAEVESRNIQERGHLEYGGINETKILTLWCQN